MSICIRLFTKMYQALLDLYILQQNVYGLRNLITIYLCAVPGDYPGAPLFTVSFIMPSEAFILSTILTAFMTILPVILPFFKRSADESTRIPGSNPSLQSLPSHLNPNREQESKYITDTAADEQDQVGVELALETYSLRSLVYLALARIHQCGTYRIIKTFGGVQSHTG